MGDKITSISWEVARGRCLTGEIQEVLPDYYVVIVTSHSHKGDKNKLGSRWLVRKKQNEPHSATNNQR